MDSRAVCLLMRKQHFNRLRDPHPHSLAFHGAGLKEFTGSQRRVDRRPAAVLLYQHVGGTVL
ncbi:MAG: hypothetical protein QF511_12030 [Rhodospirillales bacterium]|jgi:hypothetical protein|nr:hypothetical protein [Rhodospirillales bacterium]MDP7216315.1 hypothetical protein [Rhodospirillales bacterium]HIJ42405.1 hypothetical protein [Rhodospirillaceae bacterium]HIJ91965.1 hypothetical protein [Rhodospirillaceae bacterium]HJP53654.1 hypothetical protein [Rhodospirillales bacterium]